MKQRIKSFLRSMGYNIIIKKLPKHTNNEQHISLDKDELQTLEKDLKKFCANSDGTNKWADMQQIKRYLSEERIKSFHRLLNLVEQHSVSLADKSVADFGSGTGYLLRLINKKYPGTHLVGYDPYREITELAKAINPNATFYHKDVYDTINQQYDVVFCTEVLEHLVRPDLALKNLLDVVKNDGVLIITVPNGREDTMAAMRMLDHGKGYMGHVNFWSPESWKVFIEVNVTGRNFQTGMIHGNNYAFIWN